MAGAKIYRIGKHYRSLTVWTGYDSGTLLSIETVRMNPTLERRVRYQEVAKELKERGFTPPEYRDR